MNVPSADSNGKPTVISLFAGCGGSSLGYQMAGFKELLAVEWDDNAVETFRLNFPDVPVYHEDICKLSVDECLSLAEIKPEKLDVLDGSPPCQGFSTAGKRKLGDGRNQLFREYCRLLEGLQPKCFVMENVSGLIKGHMKQVYLEIVGTLRDCGYQVHGQLMNAMYYGVPQSRERVIIIGTRDDLNKEPTHPKPQTKPKTVEETIGHLPCGLPGKHEPQVIQAWFASRPGQSLREARRFVGSFQSVRLDPRQASPTQIKNHLNWHWLVPRKLTIQEAAIVHGYADNFKWPCTKTASKELIGNSVPPLFMKAIAEYIKSETLCV